MIGAQSISTATRPMALAAAAQAALAAGYKAEQVNPTIAQAYFGKAGTGNASAAGAAAGVSATTVSAGSGQ